MRPAEIRRRARLRRARKALKRRWGKTYCSEAYRVLSGEGPAHDRWFWCNKEIGHEGAHGYQKGQIPVMIERQ